MSQKRYEEHPLGLCIGLRRYVLVTAMLQKVVKQLKIFGMLPHAPVFNGKLHIHQYIPPQKK
jgi:hypothetical protein